ncbi:hypothetical protein CP533_1424 [Ophiocordyceps camponoti-saundersi (nom. inval.)]|nr:hypothetical protein CP533_1424 [Ophiocordyceps camponoti-saundersi (nom. inval.)]
MGTSTTHTYGGDGDDDGFVTSYAYTDMPFRLMLADIYCLLAYSWALPHILLPLRGRSGSFAELYPSLPNLWSLLLQVVLGFMQLGFFLILPWTVLLPVWVAALAIVSFLVANWLLCRMVNGPGIRFHSDPKYAVDRPEHRHEQWIFLNGVAAGDHWTKSNLNRLALTFGRPVMGIHNRTSGILFDIVECLVQRNFTYATADVRLTYKILRDVLYDPSKSKVIFVLHSQGGIEGGLVIDWLLQEMPQNLLSKLEVYTFGNAANHFNNPRRRASWQADRAIGHIEHYAHSTDFVALCGVIHFATVRKPPSLFFGRVFNRSTGRGGHLLNQHYLDGMFPLKRDPWSGQFVGADDDNEFMEEVVDDKDGDVRVKDLSRLWSYRNGRSPEVVVNGGNGSGSNGVA